jgi:hypothetical protein
MMRGAMVTTPLQRILQPPCMGNPTLPLPTMETAMAMATRVEAFGRGLAEFSAESLAAFWVAAGVVTMMAGVAAGVAMTVVMMTEVIVPGSFLPLGIGEIADAKGLFPMSIALIDLAA